MRASNETIAAEFVRRFANILEGTQLISAHRVVLVELAAQELKETLAHFEQRARSVDTAFAKGALDSRSPNRGMDSPWSGAATFANQPMVVQAYDFDLDEEDDQPS